MSPWHPKSTMTRIIVFPNKPLFYHEGKVTMRVRIAGEGRLWTFGHSTLNLLREVLGPCPAPRVLDVRIRVDGRRPEMVVHPVQVLWSTAYRVA